MVKNKNFLDAIKNIFKHRLGYSLFEVVISLSVFVILMLLVTSSYILAQQTYNKSSNTAELSQNARVSLDRITRELRQSVKLVTSLPATFDINNHPPREIFFQDGHDISQITYLRYYLSDNNLIREHKAYYFSSDPAAYVSYNSLDNNGQPPITSILESQTVGEYFSQLYFWGSNDYVNISLQLSKGVNSFTAKTSIFCRN